MTIPKTNENKICLVQVYLHEKVPINRHFFFIDVCQRAEQAFVFFRVSWRTLVNELFVEEDRSLFNISINVLSTVLVTVYLRCISLYFYTYLIFLLKGRPTLTTGTALSCTTLTTAPGSEFIVHSSLPVTLRLWHQIVRRTNAAAARQLLW